MMPARPGFTLIELLIVMTTMGLLAAIAVPRYDDATARARAVKVVSDVREILFAATSYNLDRYGWPEDVDAGALPDGLDRYLNAGIPMATGQYTLDWDSYPIPEGHLIGVTVTVAEGQARLAAAIARLLGPGMYMIQIDNRTTYLLNTNPRAGGGLAAEDQATDEYPDGSRRPPWAGRGRPPWTGEGPPPWAQDSAANPGGQ